MTARSSTVLECCIGPHIIFIPRTIYIKTETELEVKLTRNWKWLKPLFCSALARLEMVEKIDWKNRDYREGEAIFI